jgi:hypothetical protein
MPGGIWSALPGPDGSHTHDGDPVYVSAISLTRRMALLSTGDIVPISRMTDREGDDTDVPSECHTFIAGRNGLGWWKGPRHAYERVTKH